MAPVDLMVDLSSDHWIASTNGGAGVEVRPDNWAEAYAIDEQTAQAEIAAAGRDGLEAAATESWVIDVADSAMARLTIRRYASLRRVEHPWWMGIMAADQTPHGLTVPKGMRLACAFAHAPDTGAFRVDDAGKYRSDCVVTIGDKVIVQVSSTAVDDTVATAATVGGITRWLDGAGAVPRRD